MEHVSSSELIEQLEQKDGSYIDILNEESLAVKLAEYPNSESNASQTADDVLYNPSTASRASYAKDELYYIVSGSGKIRVNDEISTVEKGDVIYIEQGVVHEFVDTEDTITALSITV
jgi:mannose-1-phosphate guanylyltransferase